MASREDILNELTEESVACLRYGMDKIEHCLAQLDDQQVWWRPNEELNAIGNLLLHLSGSVGQWIVAGLGNVSDTRDRPGEFAERQAIPKDQVLQQLQAVVEKATKAIRGISADDLLAMNRIQGFEVSRMHALLHCITHFQGHVQEIISLTRQQLGAQYKFQWTPESGTSGSK